MLGRTFTGVSNLGCLWWDVGGEVLLVELTYMDDQVVCCRCEAEVKLRWCDVCVQALVIGCSCQCTALGNFTNSECRFSTVTEGADDLSEQCYKSTKTKNRAFYKNYYREARKTIPQAHMCKLVVVLICSHVHRFGLPSVAQIIPKIFVCAARKVFSRVGTSAAHVVTVIALVCNPECYDR